MNAGLPKGWREGHDGTAACPHRDCSVCPECAQREEVVEVLGVHYWVGDDDERQALLAVLGTDAGARP